MSKTNAKLEFLSHIRSQFVPPIESNILCATIQKGDDYGDDEEIIERTFILTTGYNQEDWNQFLSKLDFMYDSGYGGQEVFGTIWYVDGTWSERDEYDGSEWYVHRFCPQIPKELYRLDKVRDQKLNQIL